MGAVKKLGARLTTVLTTHKHHDHAGGNAELVERARREENGGVELRVYGHAMDTCHGANAEARDGDIVRVGTGTRLLITHVPCHTRGHVVYALLGAEADDERDASGATTLSNAVAAFTTPSSMEASARFFTVDRKIVTTIYTRDSPTSRTTVSCTAGTNTWIRICASPRRSIPRMRSRRLVSAPCSCIDDKT